MCYVSSQMKTKTSPKPTKPRLWAWEADFSSVLPDVLAMGALLQNSTPVSWALVPACEIDDAIGWPLGWSLDFKVPLFLLPHRLSPCPGLLEDHSFHFPAKWIASGHWTSCKARGFYTSETIVSFPLSLYSHGTRTNQAILEQGDKS